MASTVVIDPEARLPVERGEEVVYSRNSSHALMLLRARRASRTFTDVLWLRWDLGGGSDPEGADASPIVSALAEAARAGRPFPIGRIIVVTHNAERQHQVLTALTRWYDVNALSPRHAALYPYRPDPRPAGGLSSIERLRRAGVQVGPGLSDEEIEVLENRFDIEFSSPHSTLLQSGLPVDVRVDPVSGRPQWPDWRHGDRGELQNWIERGSLHDRAGAAPAPGLKVPPLIPLRGNRFVASGSHLERCWVLSAHEIDVIYYGEDIGAWIGLEFEGDLWSAARPSPEDRIPYWSDLAERQ